MLPYDDPLSNFLNSPTGDQSMSCDSSPALSSDDSSYSFYSDNSNSFGSDSYPYSFVQESTSFTSPVYRYNSSQCSTTISSLPSSIQTETCPIYMSNNYYSPPATPLRANPTSSNDIKRYSLPNIPSVQYPQTVCKSLDNLFTSYINDSDLDSSKVMYKPATNPFTQKIICFTKSDNIITTDCDICNGTTTITIKSGENAIMSCGHYIVCNECRGRTVRRILRCISCCTELCSYFPVCGPQCIGNVNSTESSNTGNCPRCGNKLQKEICNPLCTRRKMTEYSNARTQLNDKVAIFVVHPNECCKINNQRVWRPCSHYSYCVVHKLVCKGHGKEVMCHICKRAKKQLERRETPSKRRVKRCLSRSSPH